MGQSLKKKVVSLRPIVFWLHGGSGRQQGDGLPFRAARSPYSVSGRHGGQNLYYSLHKLTQHWIRSKVDDMDVKIRVPYLSRNTINGASLEEQGSA